MRERSRRRAARIDFGSLVAPEEVATFDSGSDYEGNDGSLMDIDAEVDDDLELEMNISGASEPESGEPVGELDEDSGTKKQTKRGPVADRKAAKAPQQPQTRRRAVASQSASRIENLRDRLMLFYGDSNAELVRAIELRHKWSDSLFSVTSSQLEPQETVILDSSNMKSSAVLVSKMFDVSGSAIVVDGVQIEPSSQRQSSTVAVLNAGHGVIALDWNSTGNLLALGLRTDTSDPMNATTIQPELAPTYHTQPGKTLLHLYKVENSRLAPFASIEGSYGPVVGMQWSPSSSLALVFASGSVGILDATGPGAYRLELKALPAVSGSKATCVCWRGPAVVVGYADGLVAEFDPSAEPTPSFVAQLHDSVVTSVASGWPNMTPYIFTSGVDGNLKVTDTRDLRLVRKAPRLKHLSSVATYLSMADSFISLEDANTARLVPVRNPSVQLTLTSVTRHDAGVTALATSQSHPLLLTGGQDGSLHITNPLRRAMATRRKRDLQLDCTIWRLECSHKTSEYRFVELLSVDTLNSKREGLNSMPIYPASVAVSSVAWMPGGTWYAAGTASGLVRIENVDG